MGQHPKMMFTNLELRGRRGSILIRILTWRFQIQSAGGRGGHPAIMLANCGSRGPGVVLLHCVSQFRVAGAGGAS